MRSPELGGRREGTPAGSTTGRTAGLEDSSDIVRGLFHLVIHHDRVELGAGGRLLGVGADTLQTLDAGASELQVIDADKENDLDLTNAAQDASIIRFVNQILTEAVEMRATDVHIEPFEDQLRLRYRIDGV